MILIIIILSIHTVEEKLPNVHRRSIVVTKSGHNFRRIKISLPECHVPKIPLLRHLLRGSLEPRQNANQISVLQPYGFTINSHDLLSNEHMHKCADHLNHSDCNYRSPVKIKSL